MTSPPLEKQSIHRDNLIWILLAQAASILPLLFYLPIWLVFFWLFALLWRVQIHRMRWSYPNIFGKIILGGLCVVAVYFSFHGINSVEPMIAFLVCSFVLKTVELHSKKDALIVLFIGFIAIACQFLFAQDIVSGVYGFFALIVLLSAWQAAFFSKGLSIGACLKRGGALVLQSIPFMVVLFVIMPRIGPLWSVPSTQHQGTTGFGDTLRMGDIGNLVRSSETAFRVSFKGVPPELNQMYWRGLILDQFDGLEWRAEGAGNQSHPKQSLAKIKDVEPINDEHQQDRYQYSVVMEPHGYPWLFALKTPVAVDSALLRVLTNDDGMLVASSAVTQKSEYSVVSQLDTSLSSGAPLPRAQWQALTSLPATGNEKSKTLAREWRRRYKKPSDIVQAALGFYSADFSYTLQPTLLTGNAVDQFLFESKNGFCEHFSSSFVYLMRAAGIPSRVVLGYQGGAYNTVENYFMVRQSDAHAWAEVWLDEQWQTIDPTTAVAPSRIQLGIEQSLGASDLKHLNQNFWQSDLLIGVYQRWDALGYVWNRWVLNYDTDNQEGLLKKLLGSTSPWRVGLAFLVICACIFIGYVLIQFKLKLKKVVSEENELLQPVLNKLTRRGFVRQSSESITEFSNRLLKEEPSVGKGFMNIAKAYTMSVYNPNKKSLAMLKEAIRLNR